MNAIKKIYNKIPEPVRKGIKEAARLAVLGFASAVIAVILGYIGDLPETQTTIIVTVVLRAIDKWLHERSKETKTSIKGISPF